LRCVRRWIRASTLRKSDFGLWKAQRLGARAGQYVRRVTACARTRRGSPVLADIEADDAPEETGVLLVVADAILIVDKRWLFVEEILGADRKARYPGRAPVVGTHVIPDREVESRPGAHRAVR